MPQILERGSGAELGNKNGLSRAQQGKQQSPGNENAPNCGSSQNHDRPLHSVPGLVVLSLQDPLHCHIDR